MTNWLHYADGERAGYDCTRRALVVKVELNLYNVPRTVSRSLFLSFMLALALSGCTGASMPDRTLTPSLAAPGTPASQPAATLATKAPPSAATEAKPSPAAPTIVSTATLSNATIEPTRATTPAGTASTRVASPAGQIDLPSGFGISVFAGGLDTPRNMAIGPDGQLYVAERGAGRIIRLPDINHDGLSDRLQVVAVGFDSPSSLAFYKDGSLYISTPTQVFRLSQPDADGVFQKRDLVIDGLPGRQDHFTRTLLFGPDWASLFVQVGSSCNVCNESDPRRAAIMRFNADGSGAEIYARGLRNAVGITFRPGTDELWATNNGSDNLGDNRPPDTIQIVQRGQDYGWPRCHAGNIPDPQFGGPGACSGVAKPLINLQAHSAALGLTFYTGHQFPADYRGDLFVALHGSIYRSVPTGYKVVRIHFTNGQPGQAQDFASGWLAQAGRVWG
jgi:glucose/arabinose dehydrogenase